MLLREALVGQHVFRGLLEELRGSGEPGPEPVGHPAELGHGRGVVGLGEDRADDSFDTSRTATPVDRDRASASLRDVRPRS